MNQFFPVLARCPLFDSINETDLPALLSCLGVRIASHHKNQVIFQEGDPAKHIGIVLSGAVQIVRDDYNGNRSIVARMEAGELFGESFACAQVTALPVSMTASEDCRVLLIDCRRILRSCTNVCSFHSQMIFNLLRLVATKNLVFNQKIEITSQRTTREKLMSYLLTQAKQHRSRAFTIPYNRQALADYLGVDRSAMAVEISKLRKEGLIACEKSHFELFYDQSINI